MNRNIIIILIVLVVIIGGALFMFGSSKQDSNIEVVTGDTLHVGSTFQVKLVDSANNSIANQKVTFKVLDGSKVVDTEEVTTDSMGVASLELDKISPGNYTVNVTFEGNNKYKASSITFNLVVEEGSTDPVQVDTSNIVNNTNSSTDSSGNSSNSNSGSNSGSSSSSSSGSNSGSSSSSGSGRGSNNGAFYSPQSQKTYYNGEIDLAPDGHHYKHVGNNEWVIID